MFSIASCQIRSNSTTEENSPVTQELRALFTREMSTDYDERDAFKSEGIINQCKNRSLAHGWIFAILGLEEVYIGLAFLSRK